MMKKGFTIIEIVIALAILLVTVTGVNVIYSTATQIWKLSGYNSNTAALNQAVSQRIRAEGKRNVEIIFKDTQEFYIYFNNIDGIDDAIELAISNAVDDKFNTSVNAGGSLSDCKAKGTISGALITRYGALVKISDYTALILPGVTTNKLYQLNITVWDLKRSNDLSKANSTFLIGR